jgi:two-component system chemotaxis response regulator CheB
MIKVLVVDDSVVFRSQISEALKSHKDIEVVGSAASGSIALQRLAQLSVDVVTLDMEMPEMNGVEVLREIRKRSFPVRVIIFSSQTQRGAQSALLALREGADDVVAKPSGESMTYEKASEVIRDILVPKVLQFLHKSEPIEKLKISSPEIQEVEIKKKNIRKDISSLKPTILVIGTSTGGPTALEKIFKDISGPISIPILVVQHMPPVFTEILAKRLGELSGIPTSEAKSGEKIQANHIYVAPGDYHMIVQSTIQGEHLILNQEPQRNSVRPAVDNLFESAAHVYGKNCVGFVLTGMGEDGLKGAHAIRRDGGAIVIQDKESCVVFGMPGAIYQSDDYDQIANLERITFLIKKLVSSGGK